jgi:hypothetical protein
METTPLEAFPHLLKKISAMWGTWELDVFIHNLILDSREGSRAGFPMDAAADLMFLAQCNKMVRALDLAKKLSLKLDEAYRNIEAGDHAREGGGLWIDPISGGDAARDPGPAKRPVEKTVRQAETGGGLISLVGQLMLFLIRSKILPAAIILILIGKFARKFI